VVPASHLSFWCPNSHHKYKFSRKKVAQPSAAVVPVMSNQAALFQQFQEFLSTKSEASSSSRRPTAGSVKAIAAAASLNTVSEQ